MYAKLGCIDCMLYERQEELACYHFIVIFIQLSWNCCAPHKQSRSVQTLSTGVSVLESLDMPMILCILAEQYWLYILHGIANQKMKKCMDSHRNITRVFAVHQVLCNYSLHN